MLLCLFLRRRVALPLARVALAALLVQLELLGLRVRIARQAAVSLVCAGSEPFGSGM